MEALSWRSVGDGPDDGPKAKEKRRGMWPGFCLVAFALVHLAGCSCMDGLCKKDEPKPTCTVCKIVATWNPEVAHAPDVVHGGAPVPGLVGRIYLFGQELSTAHPCR